MTFRSSQAVSRRIALQIGGTAFGTLAFPAAWGSPVANPQAPAKRVILFLLTGGPPQHETWDPKPDAPREVRGEFGVIPTRTPGLFVGELMPRTALLTEKLAVLRAVVTHDNAHSSSGYQMLTGVPHIPLNAESVTARAPNLHPSLPAVLRALRPDPARLPASIVLPEHIWNDGNFPWPGQNAGILGPQFDPWLLTCDPSTPTFQPPALTLPADVATMRLEERRRLLEQLDRDFERDAASVSTYASDAKQAWGVLTSGPARKAFELDDEPTAIRERYGRGRFAQSCLLARRLVEAGVSLVQVNWTRIADQPNQGGWDTHGQHNAACKNLLMPMMDQCFSALLEDLDQRGLLDDTLVLWMGEFGRTPRFNGNAGRDHWGHVFSAAIAGAGIRGGTVHGQSDQHAAYPLGGVAEPQDLHATIYHLLGYDPDTILHDMQGRPFPISRGRVITPILA
jgi:uncharacterized protein (DUF1501 family)